MKRHKLARLKKLTANVFDNSFHSHSSGVSDDGKVNGEVINTIDRDLLDISSSNDNYLCILAHMRLAGMFGNVT